MKKTHRPFFPGLLSGLLMMLLLSGMAGAQTISLAGKWRFQIDPADEGITRKWYSVPLSDEISLPGSMAENFKGEDITLQTKWTGSIYDSSYYFNPRLAKYRQPGNIKIPFWLTPAKHYVGAAWYQHEVIIPAGWKGKRIVLEMEYAHSETTVWVDQKEAGSQYTFVTAQKYDLSLQLSPGRHVITIRIDNRIKAINVGQDSHSLTDHTQGNWNGIVGKIQLRAGSDISFEDIQVYPDLKNRRARVAISLKGPDCKGQISLNAHSFNTSVSHEVPAVSAGFEIRNGEAKLEIMLPMGEQMQTWDEFDPALYKLAVLLTTDQGKPKEQRTPKERGIPNEQGTPNEQGKSKEEAKGAGRNKLYEKEKRAGKGKASEIVETELSFGMREFKAVGRQFVINGRPVFLRGTVNNCEFPLTGYPAMDEAAWARIFKIAKAHGLNHMRFHSWCPPEAAFIAADKAGFYLQPEGPSWANHGTSIGDNKPIDQFIYDETNRMEKAYGNYASYCMLAYGNEPRGKQLEYLSKFNHYWKSRDSRRLYTGASVGGSWPVIPNNEYMVRGGARGLSWNDRPESMSDYSALIAKFNVPFVAHEMGQYCVFPDFKEIKKYTGVYRAKNFELFEEDLKDHDMGDEAERFLMASGKLQALAYKNEIEKALRTPGYSGYQLLSLNDYPGQGTALVGILNAFWDEKGYISPEEFRRFSNSTVLLARIPKFVYQNDELFDAGVEVAHFGKAAIEQAVVSWKITNASSKVLASGEFDTKEIPIGNCFSLGKISFALSSIKAAGQLHLEVKIEGTEFANGWDFWVYPAKLPAVKTDIYYCTALDKKAEEILAKGGKVFLDASGKVIKGKEVVQTFQPVFWNTSWFKMRPPHTLGILVDPRAAAFANFPTAFHSDMQWWEIVNNSQVMNLEDFPAGFRPLVQSVDTWFLNRKLAMVYEARIGKGKLMVCSASLSAEKGPAARQLFYSLQKYMQSKAFDPAFQVDIAVVKDVFLTGSKIVFKTYTKDSPDELKPKPPKP